MCQSAIKAVVYTVTHNADSAAAITAVTAAIVISDIPIDAGSVTQTFGVSFVSPYAGKASATNGNLVSRPRSGNPGYLTGLPVLAGTLAATGVTPAQAISIEAKGLQAPSPFARISASSNSVAGQCPSFADLLSTSTINYGYDSSSGFCIYLSFVDLEMLFFIRLT